MEWEAETNKDCGERSAAYSLSDFQIYLLQLVQNKNVIATASLLSLGA